MVGEHGTREGTPDRSTEHPEGDDGPGDGGSVGADPPTGRTAGPSPTEEAALRRVRAVSRLLDDAFRVPGTDVRVGLDPVLGVIPGVGDAVGAAVSLYPVAEAYRLGMPWSTLVKMLTLVALDALVGSVPLLGPVFDAVWKANEWNRRTLERYVGAT